jgi:acyl-CoA synthetase (AMP-forming)/AMP-acid ligase II
MRLIDYFDRGADLHPGRHCLHDGMRGWTYKDVRATTHRVANVPDAPDAVVFLASSGGTTGRPKGVQITNRNIDDKWGEAVKAVVELKPGASAAADELIQLAKEKLGGVKAPKSVDFVAALPRRPVAKVLKKTLREPCWAGRERKI